MSEDKIVTPLTKRIGIICLALISIATIFSDIPIKDGLLVIVPCITTIAALIDGGK